MAGTRQTLLFAIVLVLAFPPAAPVAVAQSPSPPLDLNGTWEVTDQGDLLQSDAALVKLIHTGTTVRAVFINGIQCFDGQGRSYLFVAQLSGTRLSSTDMWVCSASPSRVRKCKVSSKYKSTFTNANVEANFIEGKRTRQILDDDDCSTKAATDADAEFALRRLAPCELEERMVKQREETLDDLVDFILAARVIFMTAIEAVDQRYGESFQGRPTSALSFPSAVVGGGWNTDLGWTEEYFADALPEALASAEWRAAREMAEDIRVLADPPIPAVARMLDEIHRIENTASQRQEALAALRKARADLENCRRGQQR
jgi:hypothetical protein